MASFALLFAPLAVAHAQQHRIPGKVIDPQGKPVANIEVLLHGVGQEKGAEVDKDTTRADGTFEMSVPSPDTTLVYFVAVVWNGQLYVGDMMRPPFPLGQEYVVQVGVNPVEIGSQTAQPEVSPQQQKKDRTAGLIVVICAILLIGVISFIVMQRQPDPRRRMLVQLARLEDEIEARPDDAALLQRREKLRQRILSK